MRTWAVIKNGVVDNTAIAERDLHATHDGDAWIDITDMTPQPQIGWTYVGGVFSPPVE